MFHFNKSRFIVVSPAFLLVSSFPISFEPTTEFLAPGENTEWAASHLSPPWRGGRGRKPGARWALSYTKGSWPRREQRSEEPWKEHNRFIVMREPITSQKFTGSQVWQLILQSRNTVIQGRDLCAGCSCVCVCVIYVLWCEWNKALRYFWFWRQTPAGIT